MPATPAGQTSTPAAKASLAKLEEISLEQLTQRVTERRAFEAVIWGMPAVNFELMYQALLQARGAMNQVVYWSRLLNWKNQTLTPNPDVIYLLPFFDTRDAGPMVLEIPPADGGSITGSIDDAWQTALEDVGPAGVDKGKGGKYLILPPDYAGAPPGYIPLEANTFRSFAILRSNLASGSDADIAKAVAYGKRVKVYPLSQADEPPPTQFVDAVDVVFDSTIPYDLRFFEQLDHFVQHEPWLTRDKAMIDTLRTIGIEKGRTFGPDSSTRTILAAAVAEAKGWLDSQYDVAFASRFFAASRWAVPAAPDVIEGMSTNFAAADTYPVDGRGLTYSFIYFSAKHLGAGQFYLMTIKDRAGDPLEGGSNYRLTVPANPPVKLYWSATIYDRTTHALIKNQPHASRASTTPGLQKNSDGSVDVFFGPRTPAGKETNWIPTDAGGRFEVLFRFYGPQKPLFDKTWVLPDIEKTA
jgi:hypothetical protein